ncbi:MAG TPA: hypothetical protein DEF51_40590 [Myxococcales bacterium]|nr:hypothetical protein [Myxococcales bacterium]
MTAVAVFGALALLSAVVWLYRRLRRALEALDPYYPMSEPLPAMLVVRPIRGRDPGLEANVRAALAQNYPAPLETLFVLDDESDPALPILRRVLARHPSANARVVFSGTPEPDRTGKLHAMIQGMAAARAQAPLVCFADSDTRPSPRLLRRLAARVMAEPDVGAAFARAVCSERPETGGDAAYALLLDGIYGPQAALSMRHHESLPFIMGQTMVLRCAALDAAGGLEASEGQLVDDMHIGARLAAAGYRNVLVGAPLRIIQRGLSWADFRSLALRWLIYGRTGIPFWPFNAPAVAWTSVYFAGLVVGVANLAAGHVGAGALALVGALAVPFALQRLRRSQGGAALPARLWWAPVATLALLPELYLRALFTRSVMWRGRVYQLDPAGALR